MDLVGAPDLKLDDDAATATAAESFSLDLAPFGREGGAPFFLLLLLSLEEAEPEAVFELFPRPQLLLPAAAAGAVAAPLPLLHVDEASVMIGRVPRRFVRSIGCFSDTYRSLFLLRERERARDGCDVVMVESEA